MVRNCSRWFDVVRGCLDCPVDFNPLQPIPTHVDPPRPIPIHLELHRTYADPPRPIPIHLELHRTYSDPRRPTSNHPEPPRTTSNHFEHIESFRPTQHQKYLAGYNQVR